jgi:predicted cupin superfamily sugar epimerase
MTENGCNKNIQNTQDVIAALKLEPHIEGGYFRRTFQTDDQPMTKPLSPKTESDAARFQRV